MALAQSLLFMLAPVLAHTYADLYIDTLWEMVSYTAGENEAESKISEMVLSKGEEKRKPKLGIGS